jgi:hypothetical protein
MIAAQIRQPFHRDGWVYEEKIECDGRVHHGGARRRSQPIAMSTDTRMAAPLPNTSAGQHLADQ